MGAIGWLVLVIVICSIGIYLGIRSKPDVSEAELEKLEKSILGKANKKKENVGSAWEDQKAAMRRKLREGREVMAARKEPPRLDYEQLTVKLRSEDAIERLGAAESLGKLRDARVVPVLIQALGDPYEGVRWQAALALGKLGDTKAVESLLRALSDGDSSVVRVSAAEALGRLADCKAIEPLKNAIDQEDSYMTTPETHEKVKTAIRMALDSIQAKRNDQSERKAEDQAVLVSQAKNHEHDTENWTRTLIKLYDQSSRGGFSRWSENEPEASDSVRKIGEEIAEEGGFDLMLHVHSMFAQQRPAFARNLEMMWSGIGEWQG